MQSRAVEQDASVLERLAAPEQYTRTRAPLLTGGMRTDKAPQDLELNEAVLIHNLTVLAGVCEVSLGYSGFSSLYLGDAQTAFQLFYPNGTSDTILVTTDYVYKYAANQWQYTTDTSAFTTTSAYSAGATAFAVNSVTGFVNGDALGIELSDGTQLQTTIVGIVSLTVTTADAVPVGKSVLSGAAVAHPRKLAGVVAGDTPASVVQFPATGWAIITNSIDVLFYYYNGITTTLAGLTSTSCKSLKVFHECLLIANTVESGTAFPQRIKMSDQGDATNWTTGISATYNLVDTPDFILQLTIVGPWLIVWREATIMRATYLGVLDEILFFEYMVYGEGLASPHAVVETTDINVFVGLTGIYSYDGGYKIASVGDAVWFNALSVNGDLNQGAKLAIFCCYVENYDEFWLFYPTGTNTTPNKLLRYSRKLKAWFEREFAAQFVEAAAYKPIVSTTWATALGSWASHTEPWNSRVLLSNIPSVLLLPAAHTTLQVYDYAATTDAGTVVDWSITTREFGQADVFTRWDALTLFGRGTGVLVEYSTDSGVTWITLSTISFGASLARFRLTFQAVSAYIMFRFSGADPTFQLAWFDIGHEFESEW